MTGAAHSMGRLIEFALLSRLACTFVFWSSRTKMHGCVLALLSTCSRPAPDRDQRPVSDSESAAIRVPSQHVRVRFSLSPKLVRQCPSRPSESWPSRDFRVSSSTRSESASCGGGYCLRVDCPPRVLANLAVRCDRLPQGGRATRPLPGAGYGAGAGGTLPYSGWAA